MNVTAAGQTYDCAPSMTDEQVWEFCRRGYLLLEAAVDDDINRTAERRLNELADEHQPLYLMEEDWLVEGIFKNPAATGAVRSLLGANFKLPQTFCNHRATCPDRAGGWHRDGGSIYTNRLDYLQVFYYPADTPIELGPTQVVPGSHFMRSKANHMGHLRTISFARSTAAPAGSIFITVYSIWHRKGPSTATGHRNMLKYNYWRTAGPKRDWIIDNDFDFSWPDMHSEPGFEQFKCGIASCQMFAWLAGVDYDHTGGQCWPCESPAKAVCDQEGLPEALRRRT